MAWLLRGDGRRTKLLQVPVRIEPLCTIEEKTGEMTHDQNQ